MRKLRSLIVFALSVAATRALAGEGVVEINQDCANSAQGCFCGDAQFLPVTITGCAGRSYRLTSDLYAGSPVVSGIVVSAPDVSIDLGGFSIWGLNVCGPPGSGCAYAGTGVGIETVAGTQGSTDRLEVKNGAIVGMGGPGIHTPAGEGHTARNVRVAHNGSLGLAIFGNGAVVENSTAMKNGDVGIAVGPSGRISASTSFHNGLHGFEGGAATLVTSVLSYANGLDGIFVRGGAKVNASAARDNGRHGIHLQAEPAPVGEIIDGGLIDGCVVQRNQADGVRAFSYALVSDSSIIDNAGNGIRVSSGAYRGNAILSNGTPVVGPPMNLGGNGCTDTFDQVTACP